MSFFLLLIIETGFAQSTYFSVSVTKVSTISDESDEPFHSSIQTYMTFQDSLIDNERYLSMFYFTANLESDESSFKFGSTDSIDEVFDNFLNHIHTFSVSENPDDIKETIDRIWADTHTDTKTLVPVVFDSLIIRQIFFTYFNRNRSNYKEMSSVMTNFYDGTNFAYHPESITKNITDSSETEVITFEKSVQKNINQVLFGEYSGGYTANDADNDLVCTIHRKSGKIISLIWTQNYSVTGFFGSNEMEAFTFDDSGKITIELTVFD